MSIMPQTRINSWHYAYNFPHSGIIPIMNAQVYRGLLLTEYFLTEGIHARQDAWHGLTYVQILKFKEETEGILARIEEGMKSRAEGRKKAKSGALFLGDGDDSSIFSEAETEQHVIFPLLRSLGWKDAYARQKPLGRDLPDVLLFPEPSKSGWSDEQAKLQAVAVQENKRWNLPLDSREGREQAPSTQMLRYLTNAASIPGGKIRWGVLSNGRLWRLYSQDASSRSEEFLELDIGKIIGLKDERERDKWLRVFMLMFRQQAFIPDPALDKRTFHQYAVNEGRLWERKITVELSRVLLEGDEPTLPILARGLARVMPGDPADPQFRADLREAAATVLFRLLFIFYAEDRGLLPVHEDDVPVSLSDIRDKIAQKIDDPRNLAFASGLHAYYDDFVAVCQLVDRGDEALKLPPYNGGLFSNDGPLAGLKIPDNIFAPVVESLSRWQLPSEEKKTRINYRDLSVQHLGAVYEQLLEREFAYHSESGEVQVRLSPYARKAGGSYYTPESLVRLIIRRTVGPLTDKKIAAFSHVAKRNKPKPSLAELLELDPARAILNLKICDPAMGSGHFLVSLVDYIADRALESIDRAEQDAQDYCGMEYHSPLAAELAEMRKNIILRSKRPLESERLGDRLLMRRLVLKRVVYGADKNPLAAELAKLSLWLHTFTVSAPLPFLDHHLRDGDSLFGQSLNPAIVIAKASGGKKFAETISHAAKKSADLMAEVENRSDADIEQAKESAVRFAQFAEKNETTARFLSLLHAEKWFVADEKSRRIPARIQRENKKARDEALDVFCSSQLGDPESILAEWKLLESPKPHKCADIMRNILARAAILHSREKPLHWDSAFPGVWPLQNGETPVGGFDAVIGNPPWERMKMQEVEWFKLRDPDVAKIKPTHRRQEEIAKRRKRGDALIHEYDEAIRAADIAMRIVRESDDYPLLSGGDTNLNSLFVERALTLIRPNGMVGLLVPSAIYSDKTAADFFRKMTEDSRIAAIYDFQNGIPKFRNNDEEADEEEGGENDGNNNSSSFFPNVHRQLRFCAFVFGGAEQKFDNPVGAFFLHSPRQVDEAERLIEINPEHFSLVNPNTRTMPTFRSRRDMKIILSIYRRLPIMREDGKSAVWPLRYNRMFDLANDTEHFKTASNLDKEGFIRVAGCIYKRGVKRCLPLYVGRMMYHFNHRNASMVKTGKGVMKPYKSKLSLPKQLCDPTFLPEPEFWVNADRVNADNIHFPEELGWALAFRDITGATNERTIVAALIPRVPCGHTLPLLLPELPSPPKDMDDKQAVRKWHKAREAALADYRANAPLYLANMCSFALDYVCRQKMQGSHLSLYILEQLPVIPAFAYGRKFGKKTAADIVRRHILQLTYVAEDMRPFARDMGYDGNPFKWDEEERAHLRARLDALYFILYGIDREDVMHIMSSAFATVKAREKKAHGCFRSRDLILAYMNALEKGNDPDSVAHLPPAPNKD